MISNARPLFAILRTVATEVCTLSGRAVFYLDTLAELVPARVDECSQT